MLIEAIALTTTLCRLLAGHHTTLRSIDFCH